MKILHIGKYYPPFVGGVESITHFVIESLPDAKHTVVSFNRSAETVTESSGDIVIIRAGVSGTFASQPVSFRYFNEIRRVIRTVKPDIVHFHYPNPLGALYILLLRKKFKLVVHWHSDIIAQRFMSKFVRPIERRILDRADAIIVTSPGYKEFAFHSQLYRIKLTMIPCSINERSFELVDSDKAKVNVIRQRYGGKKIVLFLGRHVRYKGLRYLLEAEKLVKEDCVFLIGGDGPLTESLKREFVSERIHWLGQLSDHDRKLYYSASDIYAFPSVTRNEAFGVALLEAMYCGCPPVTFTIPRSGVNWVSINNHTGLEVENRNVVEYAYTLDRLLKDDELRARLADNARQRVRQFFIKDVVSRQYKDLYKRLSDE
ncbi:MAG: glycosyltransferase [Bacteroides sp.]|nr:glycosyltransferase [Bacteroides sp.]